MMLHRWYFMIMSMVSSIIMLLFILQFYLPFITSILNASDMLPLAYSYYLVTESIKIYVRKNIYISYWHTIQLLIFIFPHQQKL